MQKDVPNSAYLEPDTHADKKVVLFGAGEFSTFLLDRLQESGWEIDFFCDNNPAKHGTLIHEIPCLAFEELLKNKENVLVIMAIVEYKSVQQQLQEAGFPLVVHHSEIRFGDTALQFLEVNLVEHCDLNCKNCNHFSNISKEHCIPLEVIEEDLQKFSSFSGDLSGDMKLIGGEPLLHPELTEIMAIARKYFPKTRIRLLTNGIKLLQMPDAFWRSCKENKIEISVTKYPIKLDYEKIQDTAAQYDVFFEYYNGALIVKTSMKYPLDLEGNLDPKDSYRQCFQARRCAMLSEGRLFLCPLIATSHIFNEKFGTKLDLLPQDYLEIRKVKSMDEITAFLQQEGTPFCRFCDIGHISYGHEWGITTGKIDEWLG